MSVRFVMFSLVFSFLANPVFPGITQLSVDADRCAIYQALTGSLGPGCVEQPLADIPTRSFLDPDLNGYFVNFDFNSDELMPNALDHLTRLSQVLNGPLLNLCVKLVGHTDTTGSPEYNMELSERRADAVRLYLAGPGLIGSVRLQADGRGESAPLPGLSGDDATNRRVEVLARPSIEGNC